MSEHHAIIDWRRAPHPTEPGSYSRNLVATLNGGQTVRASASPDYKGDPDCADPEQLLLTALASCHMLTFLAIAAFQGYRVESYRDTPVAYLEKNAEGRMAVSRIELSPQVSFGGDRVPDEAGLAKLHEGAHQGCFIARSITARVTVNPVPAIA